ncbi:hypothetical protein PILCRDRAFT_812933 [Piloderma croceum F 1598]|uniref:Uncharacterized protein n=1 Tax=Piloderma croceum (strain F 1598) TaxID=765440 RepID=A0A0C3BRC6_PILCF|nr:hypothetical protein PILCRDRAFT_812933 [Piloderma croceum F 1598]
MRRPKPYFPSISLVLAQAQCLMDHQDSYSQKQTPKSLLPPVQDDLMQSEDERDHISYIGLDMSSPYIFEQDGKLISPHKALDANEADGLIVRGRHLSLSLLVNDMSFALKRKCQQLRFKNCVADADSNPLA